MSASLKPGEPKPLPGTDNGLEMADDWPPVSAITVTYHTGPRLRDGLHGLLFDPQVSEIVIVDNGNPGADARWLDELATRYADRVQLLRPGDNLGFARGCNLGADAASGPWLLFINPDAMMKRGAVAALAQAADGQPSPWLVGGRIFGLDGREQRGGRRRELTWSTALGLSRWTLEALPAPAGPVPMDVVSGAFFMVDKAAFTALDGGFDEAYFLHVEDVDLCRRVRDAGGTVLYQPHAAALHVGGTSEARDGVVARHKADSLAYYFRKFARSPIDRILNAVLVPLLVWAVKRRRS